VSVFEDREKKSASFDGHLVEVTNKFVYLDTVDSTGYSITDIL